MVNMTLSIPKELHDKLKKYTEIRWSEVARKSFENKVKDLERIDVLKEFEDAEKVYKEGKCIPFENILKEFGIDDI